MAKKITDNDRALIKGEITKENIRDNSFLKEYYYFIEHPDQIMNMPQYAHLFAETTLDGAIKNESFGDCIPKGNTN